MIRLYYRILVSSWQTFGFFSGVSLRWLLLMPLYALFTKVTLLLDNLFFPAYRNVPVKNPVFLIGHPRSGTTFLHRLLTQTDEFAVFQLWQILFPALTARVIVKPFVDLLVRFHKATIYPKEVGHELTLETVEEEEVLFLHQLDTQFVLLVSALAFDDQEHLELCSQDQQPDARRRASVRFFKECLQRQILYSGHEQVVAKPNYSIKRIKSLLEEFPDAKFVYLVRSPYETIPSHLSLHYSIFDHQWGIENLPKDKMDRYFQRRYEYNVDLYRYFYDLQKNHEIPENNLMVINYDALREHLPETFTKFVEFTGLKCSDRLREAVAQQAQQQKKYERKHNIRELEEFGLSKEKIDADLHFVFEAYGLNSSSEA